MIAVFFQHNRYMWSERGYYLLSILSIFTVNIEVLKELLLVYLALAAWKICTINHLEGRTTLTLKKLSVQ